MRDIENGRYVKVGIEWEISVPSTQFYCEPKPALRWGWGENFIKGTVSGQHKGFFL